MNFKDLRPVTETKLKALVVVKEKAPSRYRLDISNQVVDGKIIISVYDTMYKRVITTAKCKDASKDNMIAALKRQYITLDITKINYINIGDMDDMHHTIIAKKEDLNIVAKIEENKIKIVTVQDLMEYVQTRLELESFSGVVVTDNLFDDMLDYSMTQLYPMTDEAIAEYNKAKLYRGFCITIGDKTIMFKTTKLVKGK